MKVKTGGGYFGGVRQPGDRRETTVATAGAAEWDYRC